MPRLNLNSKINILLVLVFLAGVTLGGAALARASQGRAEGEVSAKGLLLLQAMNSVRYYTTNHITPLLAAQLQTESKFISESVPAFSAREVFERLRSDEAYQSYFYKEATLNPTNPRDLVDDFERDLVTRFQIDPGTTELSGFRTIFDERLFYNARPIKITNEACLGCHGDPADAPPSLVNTYGDTGGFGWQMNDIVGAQIIYVPAADVDAITAQTFVLVMGIFVIVFAIIVFLINRLLRQSVIQPVTHLAALAGKIGQGTATPDDAAGLNPLTGRADELGQLAHVFQRMAQEVYAREQDLKRQVQELKIEIDEARRAAQVAEVVDTEYFQQLQQKAKEYRAARKGESEEQPDQSAGKQV